MLNGWQRLWLVFAGLWVLVIVWQLTLNVSAGTMAETLAFGSAWAVGPPTVVYLAGLTAAWVARGFTRTPASR